MITSGEVNLESLLPERNERAFIHPGGTRLVVEVADLHEQLPVEPRHVVGLVDVVKRGRWRGAVWLCACDCGGRRHVQASRFHEVRSCRECGARARRDALATVRPTIPSTATWQFRSPKAKQRRTE
jgi:hypothetical protein